MDLQLYFYLLLIYIALYTSRVKYLFWTSHWKCRNKHSIFRTLTQLEVLFIGIGSNTETKMATTNQHKTKCILENLLFAKPTSESFTWFYYRRRVAASQIIHLWCRQLEGTGRDLGAFHKCGEIEHSVGLQAILCDHTSATCSWRTRRFSRRPPTATRTSRWCYGLQCVCAWRKWGGRELSEDIEF